MKNFFFELETPRGSKGKNGGHIKSLGHEEIRTGLAGKLSHPHNEHFSQGV